MYLFKYQHSVAVEVNIRRIKSRDRIYHEKEKISRQMPYHNLPTTIIKIIHTIQFTQQKLCQKINHWRTSQWNIYYKV